SSSPALQDLRQHHSQRRRDSREPLLDDGLSDPLACDRLRPTPRQMVEQGDDLLQPERSFGGPLDHLEQGTKLFFRRDESAERRAQNQRFSAYDDARLAAVGIGSAHSGTTAPELSSASV